MCLFKKGFQSEKLYPIFVSDIGIIFGVYDYRMIFNKSL
jgi:hypothetical protein